MFHLRSVVTSQANKLELGNDEVAAMIMKIDRKIMMEIKLIWEKEKKKSFGIFSPLCHAAMNHKLQDLLSFLKFDWGVNVFWMIHVSQNQSCASLPNSIFWKKINHYSLNSTTIFALFRIPR